MSVMGVTISADRIRRCETLRLWEMRAEEIAELATSLAKECRDQRTTEAGQTYGSQREREVKVSQDKKSLSPAPPKAGSAPKPSPPRPKPDKLTVLA